MIFWLNSLVFHTISGDLELLFPLLNFDLYYLLSRCQILLQAIFCDLLIYNFCLVFVTVKLALHDFKSYLLNCFIINWCIDHRCLLIARRTLLCCSCYQKKQNLSSISNIFICIVWFIDKSYIWFLVPIKSYILQPLSIMFILICYWLLFLLLLLLSSTCAQVKQ